MGEQRKKLRLRGYDYRETGAYFVTICSRNRENLFGELVGGDEYIDPYARIAQSGAIFEAAGFGSLR